MRSFHNYIKSTVINRYCRNKNVLDIGIGKGGDILKYQDSKVKYLCGLDIVQMDLQKRNGITVDVDIIKSDFNKPFHTRKNNIFM